MRRWARNVLGDWRRRGAEWRLTDGEGQARRCCPAGKDLDLDGTPRVRKVDSDPSS